MYAALLKLALNQYLRYSKYYGYHCYNRRLR